MPTKRTDTQTWATPTTKREIARNDDLSHPFSYESLASNLSRGRNEEFLLCKTLFATSEQQRKAKKSS